MAYNLINIVEWWEIEIGMAPFKELMSSSSFFVFPLSFFNSNDFNKEKMYSIRWPYDKRHVDEAQTKIGAHKPHSSILNKIYKTACQRWKEVKKLTLREGLHCQSHFNFLFPCLTKISTFTFADNAHAQRKHGQTDLNPQTQPHPLTTMELYKYWMPTKKHISLHQPWSPNQMPIISSVRHWQCPTTGAALSQKKACPSWQHPSWQAVFDYLKKIVISILSWICFVLSTWNVRWEWVRDLVLSTI